MKLFSVEFLVNIVCPELPAHSLMQLLSKRLAPNSELEDLDGAIIIKNPQCSRCISIKQRNTF